MMSSCRSTSGDITDRDSKKVNIGIAVINEVDNGYSRFPGAVRPVSAGLMMDDVRLTHCPSWSL